MNVPETPVMDAHLDWTGNIDAVWGWDDDELEAAWNECDTMVEWLYDRILVRIEEYVHWRGSEIRTARKHLTRMGEANEYDFEDAPDPNWKNRMPLLQTIGSRTDWTGWRMSIGTEKMRREELVANA